MQGYANVVAGRSWLRLAQLEDFKPKLGQETAPGPASLPTLDPHLPKFLGRLHLVRQQLSEERIIERKFRIGNSVAVAETQHFLALALDSGGAARLFLLPKTRTTLQDNLVEVAPAFVQSYQALEFITDSELAGFVQPFTTLLDPRLKLWFPSPT